MQTGEVLPTSSGEPGPNAGVENPWSNMSEEAPSFSGGEKQSTDAAESGERGQTESDDYYTFEGVEFRNIRKIDISTEQGKYEWLDSLVENALAWRESEKESILSEEGLLYGVSEESREQELANNDAYQDNKRSLDIARRQGRILRELDITGEGGTLGALERKMRTFTEAMLNPNASSKAREEAGENWWAVQYLYTIVSGEMARRDPAYFGEEEMKTTLDLETKDAEKRVEQTMVDGYFDEKGFLHHAPNGEKMPGTETEDAKVDLEYAKQDVETFKLLMDDYHATVGYVVPRAIKKEDFIPTVSSFIESHTAQINQLIAESKTLEKGTPEYAENDAKRKKLARERSSARRLIAKYF